MGVILHRRPRDSHPVALLLGQIRDTVAGHARRFDHIDQQLAAMDRRLTQLTEETKMANRDRTHDDNDNVEQEPQPAQPEGPTPTQPADNPNQPQG